jgi:hypothetical protein
MAVNYDLAASMPLLLILALLNPVTYCRESVYAHDLLSSLLALLVKSRGPLLF